MTTKKRVDLDVRPYPNPIKKNYDYGEGLYYGPMSRFKSVEEFLKSRKRRKKALWDLLESIK